MEPIGWRARLGCSPTIYPEKRLSERPPAKRGRPAKMRQDTLPLRPEEIIAIRKALRRGVLEEYVDASEVARRFKLNKHTVLDLVKAGEFPGAWKPAPNRIRIPVSSVDAYVEKRKIKPEVSA